MNGISLEHAHILVVDDEEPLRNFLQLGVKRAGYGCSIAPSGREALHILEKMNVDVMITDIVMPDIDGIELTKIVKAHHNSDVIVMTGFAEGLAYERIIEIGASDFLLKPVSINEVVVRLERVLRERVLLAKHSQAEKKAEQSIVKLKRVLAGTVKALASALEKRDPYTSGHQQRVTKLACAIAKQMDLPEQQTEGIRIAGLLHDIGKISVPTDILNKPGRLSESEFNLIKEHPKVGYEVLNGIEFDQPIAQSVLQHHERMDGSGYPQGLSGEDIILEARVLAVADVVEAMASHRPYRPALGIDKALEEITLNRGVTYDCKVVDICSRLFSEKNFKFE